MSENMKEIDKIKKHPNKFLWAPGASTDLEKSERAAMTYVPKNVLDLHFKQYQLNNDEYYDEFTPKQIAKHFFYTISLLGFTEL